MMVLLNSASGAAQKQDAGRVKQAFRAAGAEPVIRIARKGTRIADLAREAVRSGERTVVAGGGDGTVSSAASALVDTEAALGVLPLGTLNHFAKDLGIPLALEAAAQTVLAGRVACVDTGEVNGRVFINNSSLGLYPRMLSVRQQQQRRGWNKRLAFAWATVNVLRRFPYLHVCLEVGNNTFRRTTPFVFVGNNEYDVEGLDLGRRPRLNGGCLWTYVAPERASRGDLLRLAVRALLGRLRRHEEFFALSAKELRIETRAPRQRVSFDGEVDWLSTPLHYRTRPGALRVLVP